MVLQLLRVSQRNSEAGKLLPSSAAGTNLHSTVKWDYEVPGPSLKEGYPLDKAVSCIHQMGTVNQSHLDTSLYRFREKSAAIGWKRQEGMQFHSG